jgi:hypothetical protein
VQGIEQMREAVHACHWRTQARRQYLLIDQVKQKLVDLLGRRLRELRAQILDERVEPDRPSACCDCGLHGPGVEHR